MVYVIGLEMYPVPSPPRLRALLESFKLAPSAVTWVMADSAQAPSMTPETPQ